jgi:NAD(P)-dependent dehydrogenase (short-subunit alcohol dehydrogenase family)
MNRVIDINVRGIMATTGGAQAQRRGGRIISTDRRGASRSGLAAYWPRGAEIFTQALSRELGASITVNNVQRVHRHDLNPMGDGRCHRGRDLADRHGSVDEIARWSGSLPGRRPWPPGRA